MTITTWVCNICGDPYVGEDAPTQCPFCGADHKYIVKGEEYKEPAVGTVTDKEKENILSAIKLEVGNSEFYFCASKKATTIELQKRFKALGKVEAEHAGTLAKLIKAQKPDISREKDDCQGNDNAFMQQALDREDKAIKAYTQFLGEANDPRIKQVFAALVEIETTHLELEKNSL